MSNKVTLVLVHGALTGSSVWDGVSQKLQEQGWTTIAPALPLRSLDSDAAYLAAFLKTIKGPMVLVGHSYAGTVISHPAIASDRVKALVFVAAFTPDSGESTGELNGRWPGSQLGEKTTTIRPSPDGDDLYLKPEDFHQVYANDLPRAIAAVMAAAQRPIAVAALLQSFNGRPSWRDAPSWAIISTDDHSLPCEAQRFMAQRAKSMITEISASHASPVSQPDVVADTIGAAARAAL